MFRNDKWKDVEGNGRNSKLLISSRSAASWEVLDAPVSILKDGKEMADKLKEQSSAARQIRFFQLAEASRSECWKRFESKKWSSVHSGQK